MTDIRVRFCETDAVGHVNNVSYFIYLEQARVDFTKKLGADIHTPDWTMAVVSLHCDYISQAYFDQELEVATSVSKIGGKSFTLVHEIRDKGDQRLIARGESVVVLLDSERKKAIPLNAEWVRKLEKHRGGTKE
ncbi:MAG: acyl-CoA thioesterase [Tuberibacillus sp.]